MDQRPIGAALARPHNLPACTTQFVMEGVSTTGGKGIQFHVGCLHLWDSERCAPGRESTSVPLPKYGPGE
jgi:hypothetical protein